MQIRIEGAGLAGREFGEYRNVHVGVQRRGAPAELLGVAPADRAAISWVLDCEVRDGEPRGPFIQGRPGARFIYLCWVAVDPVPVGFRRAKLMLDSVPTETMSTACEVGVLVGALNLTDRRGWPICAAVRPPLIEWSSALPIARSDFARDDSYNM